MANDTRLTALRLTPKITRKVAVVALTAAQITTLHSAPVTLVTAPATGLALVVRSCLFQFKYGTVQFTGGGAVTPVYHGATTALTSGNAAAATIQAAASALSDLGAAAGVVATPATGIDLYAASADFAAGDGTAVVTIEYDTVTLS